MIDLGRKDCCVCRKCDNHQEECVDQYTIREEGKSVRLSPRKGEEAMAIVLDGCVITDNKTKCDALFLYQSGMKKYSFLVELKGAGEIQKAFHQLAHTKERDEYVEILEKFKMTDGRKVFQKFAIVSNGQLPKTQVEKLEREYGIRVGTILHSEACSAVPDLRGRV